MSKFDDLPILQSLTLISRTAGTTAGEYGDILWTEATTTATGVFEYLRKEEDGRVVIESGDIDVYDAKAYIVNSSVITQDDIIYFNSIRFVVKSVFKTYDDDIVDHFECYLSKEVV